MISVYHSVSLSSRTRTKNLRPKDHARKSVQLVSQNKFSPEICPYPFDTSEKLETLIKRFERSGRAQNVSFRKLVPWIKMGERATHYLHSYPAKMLPQIAHFFLAASKLSPANEIVLDPFGGSGTVMLEAILAQRRAYYADVNPLARLITKVKTTAIDITAAKHAFDRVKNCYSQQVCGTIPDVVNIVHWYDQPTIAELSRIKAAIDNEVSGPIHDFLRVTFSTVARKASLADPRLSVPVRLKHARGRGDSTRQHKPKARKSPFDLFAEQFNDNCRRQKELQLMLKKPTHTYSLGNDARRLYVGNCKPRRLRKSSVGLILTSPPYAGAQKYIRASSLNLGWLGLAKTDGLKPLENASIGREHLRLAEYKQLNKTGLTSADRLIASVFKTNPLRAGIISTYLVEMKAAIDEMCRVLKPGGLIVLVIGNNEVCSRPCRSSEYLRILFEEKGLKVRLKLIDAIKSRGLMTKRNKTASVITREWVLLLQKPIT